MKSIVKILTGLVIAVVVVTAGCISENTSDDKSKDQTNEDNNAQEQVEMTNGQIIVNDYGNSNWGQPAQAFNSSQLAMMENALTNGVAIEDPQNDWCTIPDTLPEGEVDNTNPYPLPWTDLRSVSFGADNEYIYFKFQFWGNFPRDAVTYDGDLIRECNGYVGEMTFGPEENDWAQFQTSISYMDASNKSQIADMPQLHHEAYIWPTGEVDSVLDSIYEIQTREGLIGGGADTDYLITAYPLKLFNLTLGDTITFCLGSETHSTIYHHVAKDQILGNASTVRGPDLQYVLGSNTYENMGVPDWAFRPGEGENQ